MEEVQLILANVLVIGLSLGLAIISVNRVFEFEWFQVLALLMLPIAIALVWNLVLAAMIAYLPILFKKFEDQDESEISLNSYLINFSNLAKTISAMLSKCIVASTIGATILIVTIMFNLCFGQNNRVDEISLFGSRHIVFGYFEEFKLEEGIFCGESRFLAKVALATVRDGESYLTGERRWYTLAESGINTDGVTHLGAQRASQRGLLAEFTIEPKLFRFCSDGDIKNLEFFSWIRNHR